MKTRVTSSSLAGELLPAVHKTLQTLMHNWGSLVCWGGGGAPGQLSLVVGCPPTLADESGLGQCPGAQRGWLCWLRSKGRFPHQASPQG